MQLPETDRYDTADSKENAERDAEAPGGLHLVACSLGGAGPDPVVDLGHVDSDGIKEGRGGAGVWKSGAVEVGERFADCDGDNDDCDQEE